MENFIHVASQGLMISAAVVFVYLIARTKNASNRPLPLMRHKIAAFLLLTAVYTGAVYGNQWLKYGNDYDYMLKFTLNDDNQAHLGKDTTLLKTIIPGLKKKAKKNNVLNVEIVSYGSNALWHLYSDTDVVSWGRVEDSLRSEIQNVLNESFGDDFEKIIFTLSLGIKKGQKLNQMDLEPSYYIIKFRALNVTWLMNLDPPSSTPLPVPDIKTENLIDPLDLEIETEDLDYEIEIPTEGEIEQ